MPPRPVSTGEQPRAASLFGGEALRGPAFFAHADNHLIDLQSAMIVDVEASRAVRQVPAAG
jgi:hypothetical protein